MRVSTAKSYFRSLSALSRSEQDLVNRTFMDFIRAPEAPGHRLHALNLRERRFNSISPNMDLRIIALKEGDHLLMVYVAHHDAAYRWAERRQYEVHPVTGAAQIVEIDEVVREEVRVISRTVEAESALPPPLFAGENRDYLLSLGVPEVYLDAVGAVRGDDDLVALLDRLPEEAAEALIELSDGRRPAPATVVLPSEAAHPIEHPDARRRFWTTTEEAELARALEMPWAEWLVFLHPSQRNAVEKNFGGAARVSGAAGTGKSVVAMHRAARLAEASSGKLLLTTYSKTLATRLSDGMDALLGSGSAARRRVEVMHLHAYAMGHASRIEKPSVADGPLIDHLLREAGRGVEAPFGFTFLRQEWDAVIDYWGIKSFEAYRDIPRIGRGMSLSPQQRKRLWEVFASVQAGLRRAGMMTWGDVCDLMRARIEADGIHPFQHVIVDEAQDLGPRELRLIAALAEPGQHALFFAGDIGQRIFRWPFAWLSAGVDVRGRAQRLKVNYRTTAEIKRFSDRLLPGTITEVDGEAEERGALSLLRGADPELRPAPNVAAEANVLAEFINAALADGLEPTEIAVLGRTRSALQQRAQLALTRLGLEHVWLSSDTDVESGRVNLVTLHAAKGLEFRAVALVGCDDTQLPLKEALALDPEPNARRIIEEKELSLFYVGCTRARDRLLVTWSGTPSRFITTRLNPQP
jgi:hypothetical protein